MVGRLKGGDVGGIVFLKSVSLFMIGRLSRGGGGGYCLSEVCVCPAGGHATLRNRTL